MDARRITADRVAEVITWVDQGFIPVIVITGPSMSVDLPPDRIVDVPVAAPAVRDAWLDYLTKQIDSPRTVDTLQRLEPEDVRERLLHGNEKMSASAPSDLGALIRPVIPTFQLSHVIVPDQVEGTVSPVSRVRLGSSHRRLGDASGRNQRARNHGTIRWAVRHGKDHCGSLAGELGVPLFHVDSSSVVDKYIGETEKDSSRSSPQRSTSTGCSSTRRTPCSGSVQVSDARDRHVNIEVAYLLQRMESFDGLAIPTSTFAPTSMMHSRADCIVDFPNRFRNCARRSGDVPR